MAAPADPRAETRYLRSSDIGHQKNWGKQARLVAAAGGPGPWRQLWQVLRLSLRRGEVDAWDYYRFGVWKGGIGRAHTRTFVAEAHRSAYNHALHDGDCAGDMEAVRSKLETERRLVAAGLECVRTRAAIGVNGDVPEHVVRLADEAELDAMLSDPAAYPMFVKPLTGSFASGTAAFEAAEGDNIRLTTGRSAPRSAIVREMLAEADGYLLQPLMTAAPEVARHAGRAMPSLRITTIRLEDGPEPWYAAIRLPAPTQMSDGGSVNLRIWSEIDLETGRALRWRRVGSPHNAVPSYWADKETPLAEFRVPGIARAAALCRAGHAAFPSLGIIGWDVFVTPDGPLLNEANGDPFPILQSVRAEGIRQGAPEAVYQRALAVARARRDIGLA